MSDDRLLFDINIDKRKSTLINKLIKLSRLLNGVLKKNSYIATKARKALSCLTEVS